MAQEHSFEDSLDLEDPDLDLGTPVPVDPGLVAHMDQMETTLQTLLESMRQLNEIQTKAKHEDKGKTMLMPDEPAVPHEPIVGSSSVGRWQLKDLTPPKYHGTTNVCTVDAVEQWLSKWEQCFRLCNITEDVMKIQQATYSLLDVAHRWWRKIEQDKTEPQSWVDFKILFYNNFVPPDERTRALDSWFFLSQKNYSVQEYADKYREVLLKVPEHIPDFLQVHKFVLGLKETLRPLVRKEKCTTSNQAIELALVLEDGKRFASTIGQRLSWDKSAEDPICSYLCICCLKASWQRS